MQSVKIVSAMEYFELNLWYLTNLLFCMVHSGPVPTDDYLQIDLSQYGTRIFGSPSVHVGQQVKNWSKSKNTLGNAEEFGTYLEGDLLIPVAKTSMGRNGMVAESYRWVNGEVPFELNGNFDARAMDLIEKAINAYHQNTCIKFIPRRSTDRDYITIQSDNSGCWSSVGRTGGRQVVNLQSPGCTSKIGTIIHELMHTVGFLHEQNREERDSFVAIMYSNIRNGYENNFIKAARGTTSGFGVGYDYGSVMHYSENAFSVNGQPTIVTKNKQKIGQREGFSQSDIKKIKNMYKCKATTSSTGYKPEIKITSLISDFISKVASNGDEVEIEIK